MTGTVLAFFRLEAAPKVSNRTLTFEERVSYQRAIEEVYWRHRIWPKERPDAKPSLDAVMSQAQLERKSRLFAQLRGASDYWQRRLPRAVAGGNERSTKTARMLANFEASGMIPCHRWRLARPALVERLLTNGMP